MDKFEIEDAEAWARASAGTASYCPFCGYSVTRKEDEDGVNNGVYECPDCEATYRIIDKRREE